MKAKKSMSVCVCVCGVAEVLWLFSTYVHPLSEKET